MRRMRFNMSTELVQRNPGGKACHPPCCADDKEWIATARPRRFSKDSLTTHQSFTPHAPRVPPPTARASQLIDNPAFPSPAA